MYEEFFESQYATPNTLKILEEVISLEEQPLKLDEDPKYDLKPILAKHMNHIRINDNLVRDIDYYLTSFINKNEEHIAFFGGNLTGVNRIVFSSDDRNAWAIELLDIDELEIKKEVRSLEHIGDDWVRGTDGINLSMLYLCHLIHKSSLSEQKKKKAIIDVLVLLQIKFLSSIVCSWFKYPVSENLALAVYDALNLKFYLKKYKTWLALLQARAEDIYSSSSRHMQVIETFEPDKRVQYMITDLQTRLKSIVLNIYEITVRLNAKGVGLDSKNMLMDNAGTLEIKDISRDFDSYLNYINSTMQEPRAFIKDELVDIIADSITTMPKKLLYDLLLVVSDKASHNDKDIVKYTREIMIYTFDYFRENKRDLKDMSNLGKLIITFKSLFTASKTNSTVVLELREYFDKLVKKNIASKNPATISGVRTGIVLYIILRTLTKHHYG